ESIGLDRIHAHETALVTSTREASSQINSVASFGPEDSAGIVSFSIQGVHPHDIGTILDEAGVAVRAGHHCAQPSMETLGVDATARASFGVYNTADDVAASVRGIEREVSAVEQPPRARVEAAEETPGQTLERKRDYLE
ncbi:hypothetical protein OY671_012296, partial [Metschnikowia pulcherrima]